MTDALNLTQELIRRKSITPNDSGCQELLRSRLEKCGFHVESINVEGVSNLWATHGQGSPCFVFAGHTDVVPSGELSEWNTDPFVPTIKDGKLFGRGAADMKSGLAAMVVACETIVAKNKKHPGTLALLITSDEEGKAEHGTKAVIEKIMERNHPIDYCVVGEATSAKCLGDAIRVGRRGSLHGYITIHGTAGHVAYPDKVKNIIHLALPALEELTRETWDSGNSVFPATSFQIINVNSNSPAENSTSSQLSIHMNFRFSSLVTDEQLKTRVEAIFNNHGLKINARWNTSAMPFYTPPGALVKAVEMVIQKTCGIKTELSTAGGTSDGRFIATTGAEVIELGPINATIHKANEELNIDDLPTLVTLYHDIALTLLTGH